MTDWLTPAQQTTLLILISLILAFVLLRQVGRFLRRFSRTVEILHAQEREFNEPSVGYLPAPWRELRAEVDMANRALNYRVFEKTRQVFLDHYTHESLTPAALTAEYAADEFLLVLDQHGKPISPDARMVENYQKTAAKFPLLKKWFSEVVIEEGQWAGLRTLLAARWLCHLVGLRHAVVELFLDLPDRPGFTLLRVIPPDAYDNDEENRFDLPCTVHVSGTDAPLAALEMELQEICGLSFDDLEDLRLLSAYNAYGDEDAEAGTRLFLSNEHRLLYRARLRDRQRLFSDTNAGLAEMPLEELRALIREAPDRVTGRLSDALGYYTDAAVQP